jgi:hypothetical protein
MNIIFYEGYFLTDQTGLVQPREGLGGSLVARLSAIATTKSLEGLSYVHTPFYQLSDFPGAEERLEAFFNLGEGELDIRKIGGFSMDLYPNEFHAYDIPKADCDSGQWLRLNKSFILFSYVVCIFPWDGGVRIPIPVRYRGS